MKKHITFIMAVLAISAAFSAITAAVADSDPAEGEVESLVVLISDFGTSDFYVGAFEGSVYSANPNNARISTITHEVASFNVAEGSYLLGMAAMEYPSGTVFAADIDPGAVADERSIVLLTEDGKIFVGPDNGLFTDVMNELGVASVWEITNRSLTGRESASATFKGIGIYGPVAGHLSAGVDPALVGPEISDPIKIDLSEAKIEDGALVGTVAHVDHWGNLITNIPQKLVDESDLLPGDSIEIAFGGGEADKGNEAVKVEGTFGTTYGDVPEGEWVAFVSSLGRLEIAINMDSASDALGIGAGAEVRIGSI
jgi:S-adenosylmethionine hydrolase